jgi:hypothetical protein
MTRVVTALKAGHARHFVGQQIDDLALALVAPLGADDDYVLVHRKSGCLLKARRMAMEKCQGSASSDQDESCAYEVQQCQPCSHADNAADAQLCVRKIGERQHDTLHGLRVEKRQNALEHQIKRQRGEQIGPIHRRGVLQRLVERSRYLKNSLSGEITNTSLSVPIALRYACMLR